MIQHELLRDSYTPLEAIEIQKKWRDQLKPSLFSHTIDLALVHHIVGVDIAYPPIRNITWGIACAVLWDVNKQCELRHKCVLGEINFPYIPGLLGFHEGKLLSQAIKQLGYQPDLIMVDGHGWLHPRRMGEAVHIGVALGISTLGIAKKALFGEGDWRNIDQIKGSRIALHVPGVPVENRDETTLLGYAICLSNHRKPVFVSPGYLIQPHLACDIALQATSNHRQPDPLILAHMYAHYEIGQRINISLEKS